MEIISNINENIKYLRESNSMSQSDFGKIINKGASLVSAYEKGVSVPPLSVIMKIADEFNCSIDDLVNANLKNTGNSNINDYKSNNNGNLNSKVIEKSIYNSDILNNDIFQKCKEKAEELTDIVEALLKVLNMSNARHRIVLEKDMVETIKTLQDSGITNILSMLLKTTDNENREEIRERELSKIYNDLSIKLPYAKELLYNYIDEVQFELLSPNDRKGAFLIEPDDFLEYKD